MNTPQIIISTKQLLTAILIMLNTLVIGPGGWILTELWTANKTFIAETKTKLTAITKELHTLQVESAQTYMTKEEFAQFENNLLEHLQHLDSKIDDRGKAP